MIEGWEEEDVSGGGDNVVAGAIGGRGWESGTNSSGDNDDGPGV